MRVFWLAIAGIMVLWSVGLTQNQIDPDWVYRWQFSPTESDQGDVIGTDLFGNVYVAGHTDTSANYNDWVILRLDSDGDSLWLDFYDSPITLHRKVGVNNEIRSFIKRIDLNGFGLDGNDRRVVVPGDRACK